ncbi:hypothetical protein [Mesorhizobium sp. M1406]|uniref:hypothetical protein n=1 Tax=Mesorhizobium sp. M1406 TaxID=2957099 RepID=UPI003336F081
MAGPWEKYQTTPDVPPGFRIVSQPAPAKPRFPGVPVDAAPTSDPWAQFPDAPAANIFDQFDAPAAKQPPASPIGPFPGMLEQGNIDLNARPIVKNADGSYSTVRSMSFGDDSGREILVPTVSQDGKIIEDGAAADQYGRTGQNLGKFDTPAHADMYAEALHKAQDQHYGAQAQAQTENVFDQFDDIPPGFKIISHPATAKGARVGNGAFGSTAGSQPVILEINGRKVEVDEGFRSMAREQQDATVDEIAKSLSSPEGPWTKYGKQTTAALDNSDPWAAFPDAAQAIRPGVKTLNSKVSALNSLRTSRTRRFPTRWRP